MGNQGTSRNAHDEVWGLFMLIWFTKVIRFILKTQIECNLAPRSFYVPFLRLTGADGVFEKPLSE